MRLWYAMCLALAACAPEAPPLERVVDTIDLVLEQDARVTLDENPSAPVSVGMLYTKPEQLDRGLLGGALELPALILPPPARVEIRVPASVLGRLELTGGFAINQRQEKDRRTFFEGRVGCTLDLVRGDQLRRVFTAELEGTGYKQIHQAWQPLIDQTSGQRLWVQAGDRLILSTAVTAGTASATMPRIGFGGLALEQRIEVARTKASPSRPNIVFMVMDTLRADHTSTFGSQLPTTPNLDRLAARGTAFEDARSAASWTYPATASMLTGLLPSEHGVEANSPLFWLDSKLVTLAEVMQAAGISTAAFTGNRLIAPDSNFDQGFETFHGPDRHAFIDGAELMPPALEWLDAHQDERFFLYLHLVDPHEPHDPLPASVAALPGEEQPAVNLEALSAQLYEESQRVPTRRDRPLLTELMTRKQFSWMERSYDQAVHTGDLWLGTLLERLDALGLSEDTIVVFTSDHGEELYEHGALGHSQSLFPELVHVPLVIAGPGVPEGRRVEGLRSTRRLFDYLSEVASAPPGVPLANPDEAVFYSTHRGRWGASKKLGMVGIERMPWALITIPTLDQELLFNVLDDPGEHVDLAAEVPDTAALLRAELLARLAEAAARRASLGAAAEVEGDTSLLEDLGYL